MGKRLEDQLQEYDPDSRNSPNYDSLSQYLSEIRNYPLLKREEEVELAKKIESGYQQLFYQAYQYKKDDLQYGQSLLEATLREELGKKNQLYRNFLKLRKKESKASKTTAAHAIQKSIFELIYYGRTGQPENNSGKYCGLKEPQRMIEQVAKDVLNVTESKTYQQKFYQAQASIQQAKQRFIEANLRLVIKFAKKQKTTSLSLNDLIQEGNQGLIKAIKRYDYRTGYRFSTYASWWIEHHIGRAISDKEKDIRIPVFMFENRNKYYRSIRQLVSKLGRKPTLDEIAKHTGFSIDNINHLLTLPETLSLDEKISERGEETRHYLITDQSEPRNQDDFFELRILYSSLKVLNPKEEGIIRKRFGLDQERKTLDEISKEYNVTRERIRQIEEKALRKLRKELTKRGVTRYIPDSDY